MLRTRTTVISALVALSLTAPATAAAQQDLRSPDTRDAATVVRQDLRSPDARDAGVVRQSASSLSAPAPSPVAAPSGGFSWGDAGIGAAGMLGLLLGGAGVSVLVAHHRRGPGGIATGSV